MTTTVTTNETLNSVSIAATTTLVEPAITNPTISIEDLFPQVLLSDDRVALSIVDSPVAVEVQSASISVITGATQGPQGPIGLQGPTGATGPQGPSSGDEISVLNKAERRDTVEDSPFAGDITVYYGIAVPQSLETAAVWLITKIIYTKDGGAFDSAKTYASTTEDMKWSDHLIHTYT